MKTKSLLLYIIFFLLIFAGLIYASSLLPIKNPGAVAKTASPENSPLFSPSFFSPATQTVFNNPSEKPPKATEINISENTSLNDLPTPRNSSASPSSALPTPTPHQATSSPGQKSSITLAFTGDVLLDRGVKTYLYQKGYDYVIPKDVREHLRSADIAMINLENPISKRGEPMPDKEWVFRADPAHFSLLQEMGVDIVNLANNHTLDYGLTAFLDTLDILEKNNLPYVGGGRNIDEAYRPVILEAGGVKIAFLGANRVMPDMSWYATETRPGLAATYKPDRLLSEITKIRNKVDYVFVMAHWGVERKDKPESYQKELARKYIDAGADGVIASHPHVMQGFEFYKGKPIAYSLGNFIFTDSQKDTAIFKLHISNNEIRPQIVPCEIKSLRTRLMPSEKQQEFYKYLESISFGVSIDQQGFICPK